MTRRTIVVLAGTALLAGLGAGAAHAGGESAEMAPPLPVPALPATPVGDPTPPPPTDDDTWVCVFVESTSVCVHDPIDISIPRPL